MYPHSTKLTFEERIEYGLTANEKLHLTARNTRSIEFTYTHTHTHIYYYIDDRPETIENLCRIEKALEHCNIDCEPKRLIEGRALTPFSVFSLLTSKSAIFFSLCCRLICGNRAFICNASLTIFYRTLPSIERGTALLGNSLLTELYIGCVMVFVVMPSFRKSFI